MAWFWSKLARDNFILTKIGLVSLDFGENWIRNSLNLLWDILVQWNKNFHNNSIKNEYTKKNILFLEKK